MKWFNENELPKITDIDSLEQAFGAVKARFNGHPHKYTRNDYLLFINTIYAALTANYADTDQSVSAELTQDLNVDYPLEVGYVKNSNHFSKGTSLEDVIRTILKGDSGTVILDEPIVYYQNCNESNNIIQFDDHAIVTLSNNNPNISDIYYSLSTDHGWRLYDQPFAIFEDTDVKIKIVPNYKAGYKYTESKTLIKNFRKIIITQLLSPVITISPDYTECLIDISNPNNSGKIQYKLDNGQWIDYINIFSINDGSNPKIYTKVIPTDQTHTESNITDGVVVYNTIPNPKFKYHDLLDNTKKSIDETFSKVNYYGQYIIDEQFIEPFDFAYEIELTDISDNVKHAITKVLMGDGITYRYSSGYNITFNQLWLSLKKPVITGVDNFTDSCVVIVNKNQDSYNNYVNLVVSINGQELKGEQFTITETSQINAVVSVLEEYKSLFSSEQQFNTATFNKKEVVIPIIYSSMLDPVGKTYQYVSINEFGMTEQKVATINNIGDTFSTGDFDNYYSEQESIIEENKSGYYVKLMDDTNPIIYSNLKDLQNKVDIYAKNSTIQGWPNSSLETSNLASKLVYIGEEVFNNNTYSKYEFNIENNSHMLYNIIIK